MPIGRSKDRERMEEGEDAKEQRIEGAMAKTRNYESERTKAKTRSHFAFVLSRLRLRPFALLPTSFLTFASSPSFIRERAKTQWL